MKDFRGTELEIGDIVAVAVCGGSYATRLEEWEIVGFCKRSGYDCVKLIPHNDSISDNVMVYYNDNPMIKATHKIVKIEIPLSNTMLGDNVWVNKNL